MKIKLGVTFEVGKIDTDPFQDEEDKPTEMKSHDMEHSTYNMNQSNYSKWNKLGNKKKLHVQ